VRRRPIVPVSHLADERDQRSLADILVLPTRRAEQDLAQIQFTIRRELRDGGGLDHRNAEQHRRGDVPRLMRSCAPDLGQALSCGGVHDLAPLDRNAARTSARTTGFSFSATSSASDSSHSGGGEGGGWNIRSTSSAGNARTPESKLDARGGVDGAAVERGDRVAQVQQAMPIGRQPELELASEPGGVQARLWAHRRGGQIGVLSHVPGTFSQLMRGPAGARQPARRPFSRSSRSDARSSRTRGGDGLSCSGEAGSRSPSSALNTPDNPCPEISPAPLDRGVLCEGDTRCCGFSFVPGRSERQWRTPGRRRGRCFAPRFKSWTVGTRERAGTAARRPHHPRQARLRARTSAGGSGRGLEQPSKETGRTGLVGVLARGDFVALASFRKLFRRRAPFRRTLLGPS
jgi:hypothetical protein